MEIHDNAIEFYTESDRVTVTFHRAKYKNKIIKLAEKHPDEVDYLINPDGTLYGHIPVSWVKIIPKREVSEEERNSRRESFNARFHPDTAV